MEDTRPQSALAYLPLAVVFSCTFHESIPVELESGLSGARSAIVFVESADTVAVSALDLASTPVPELPFLDTEDSGPLTVSARFFLSSLEELDISVRGPLPAGAGGPVPEPPVDARRDQVCVVEGSAECIWREGELGRLARSFTSPALPPATRCRPFEPTVIHTVGPGGAETHGAIRKGARLGRDGLLLQSNDRLLLANEAGVRLINDEIEGLAELIPFPIRHLITLPDRVVLASCPSGQPQLAALGPDFVLSPLPSAGLPRCPAALSSWGEDLYALSSSVGVMKLDRGAQRWRPLVAFDDTITSFSFIAYGPDRVAGVYGSAEPRYSVRTATPLRARSHTLNIQEGTRFQIATPAVVDGRAFFAFSENISGVYLVGGSDEEGFDTVAQRGTQLLTALAPFERTVLATGGFGPIVQFDPEREQSCADSVIVNSSVLFVIEALGDGRFVLAGDTRYDPLSSENPREEPQRIAIAEVSSP